MGKSSKKKSKSYIKKSNLNFSHSSFDPYIQNRPVRNNASNIRTGEGTLLDPTQFLLASASRIPTSDILRLYQTNALFSKIIDIYVDSCFSKPLLFKNLTERQENKLRQVISKIRIQDELRDAFMLSFLKGSSLIILGLQESGEEKFLSEPVKLEQLEKILWARSIDRDSFWFTEDDIDWEINSLNYGRPFRYRLKSRKNEEIIIHASRCLVFFGRKFIRGASLHTEAGAQIGSNPNFNSINNNSQKLKDQFLGTSFCENIVSSVLSYQVALKITLSSMMKNIREIVTYNPTETIKSQQELEDNIRDSVTMNTSLGTIIVPDGMDLKIVEANLSQNKEIIESLLKDISTVTGIPQIHLTGQAPAGLGRTNFAEMKIFNDRARSLQEKISRDPLTNLLQIVINCSEYSLRLKEVPEFEFEEITSLSEIEKSEIELKKESVKSLHQDVIEKKLKNIETLEFLGIDSTPIKDQLKMELEQ